MLARAQDARPHVYLASPAVFRPDALEYYAWLLDRCAAFGLIGISPFDVSDTDGGIRRAGGIFNQNIEKLYRADFVLADLNPFRGVEPDSGTIFEVGFAYAQGKTIYGYVLDSRPQIERIGRVDENEWRVEDFGLPVNLMLGQAVRLVHGTEEDGLMAIAKDACALPEVYLKRRSHRAMLEQGLKSLARLSHGSRSYA